MLGSHCLAQRVGGAFGHYNR